VAEEESKAEDGQEEEASGGKSNKKVIIIVALIAVLAIGLSVGVTVFLLGGDDSDVEGDDIEIVEEPVKLPASYFELKPPFLVTFDVGGRQRYMQVHVSVSSRDMSAFDAIEHHMPLIRSKIISAYSAVKFEEIQADAGKLALQVKTIEVINGVLEGEGATQVENVFFTNFVLQ